MSSGRYRFFLGIIAGLFMILAIALFVQFLLYDPQKLPEYQQELVKVASHKANL